MIRIYTAVGFFTTKIDTGIEYPYVTAGDRDLQIDIYEFLVWSSLIYNFLTEQEAEHEYLTMVRKDNPAAADKFSDTFQRLCARGLIVSGEGHNVVDALDSLLGNVTIIPKNNFILDRFTLFLSKTIIDRSPLRKAFEIFLSTNLTSDEKIVLKKLREHITLNNTYNALPENPDWTQEIFNISEVHPKKAWFISVIGNLYHKKLLTFDN